MSDKLTFSLPPPPPPQRRGPPPLPPFRQPMPPRRPVDLSHIRIPPSPPPNAAPIKVSEFTPSAPPLIPIRNRPQPPVPIAIVITPSAPPPIPIRNRPQPPVPTSVSGAYPPPPPPPKRLTPPLPPIRQPLPLGRPVKVSDVRVPPPPPPIRQKPTEAQAATLIQRAFQTSRKFRKFLNTKRAQKTDPTNLQRSSPLVLRTFSTEQEKEIAKSDLEKWFGSGKQHVLKTDDEIQLIIDCSSLRADIIDAIEKGSPGQVIGVYDEKGVLQAAAFVSTKNGFFEVLQIVSAPWNQEIEMYKDDPRRVRGAGTAVIEEAISTSMRAGYHGDIHLDAVETAVPFYKKIGLEVEQRVPDNWNLLPMKLDKIVEFFRSFGGRALPA